MAFLLCCMMSVGRDGEKHVAGNSKILGCQRVGLDVGRYPDICASTIQMGDSTGAMPCNESNSCL